ncbi:hypothetical protein PVK06_034174 [Gossypium arboreum]|uniref:Aminotransferase-like plant mobile domain-containing protein n=1 Tax=Gossypium arboreum TaxID=29729 RepID=A0ABR0NFK1_GOSAR|nr:hypothetical protein PVK06_034174 [Gossypium arboreum]
MLGYKLDPTFISALAEIWRPETHTFHLLGDKCKITLEDVTLQLGLPMDEPIVMGSTIVPSKEGLCKAFLEKVPNKFYGGWIDMKWLKTNFKNLLKDASDIVKEKYA